MTSDRQSPTNRTYLISITAAQSVSGICANLQDLFRGNGITDSPIPPGIPVLQTIQEPVPPVPGLLPACKTPLIMAGHLSVEDWITWPVESSPWLNELGDALTEHIGRDLVSGMQEELFIPQAGIPLGIITGKDRIFDLPSTEVSKYMKKIPGWRAINLVCWSIEYLSSRPWYQSAAWYPLWQRRLKRAPSQANINKGVYLD